MLGTKQNRLDALTNFLTEHFHIEKRMARVGLTQNSDYRFCREEDESLDELTQNYKASTKVRVNHLRQRRRKNSFSETVRAIAVFAGKP